MKSWASLNGPLIDLCNPANAWPAIFSDAQHVFQTVDIGSLVLALLLRSLLADRISLVNVINAQHLQVMWALTVNYGSGKLVGQVETGP